MISKSEKSLYFLFDHSLVREESYKLEIKEKDIENLKNSVFSLKEENITMGKKSGNEENVKIKVVLPILQFLGYNIGEDLNFEEAATKGSIDVTVRIESDQKSPTALLELKFWKKDLDKYSSKDKVRYRSDVQQGLIYAAEMGIDWFIITNGYDWRFYKTHISGQIVYNFYEHFTLDSLEDIETLRVFYTVFSKKSFIGKIQDKLFSKTELLKETLNEEIYDILVDCRHLLFKDLLELNRETFESEKTLMEIGQKLLDRFVFIRFAEDNRLFNKQFLKIYRETWSSLPANVRDKTPFILFISDLFKNIYEGSKEDDIFPYNGGLFSPDPIIMKLSISNDVLTTIISKLYFYKDGKYIDFSIIPIDILGNIYEQYLGLTLIIKEQGPDLILKEESTKTTRKKFGIYYTPKYIVNFIIENTILNTLENNIDYLPNLTILDPACGSGTFLSSAYDILYDKYLEYNEIVKAKSTSSKLDVFIEQMQQYKTQFDTSILSTNLYGVDLNTESVEITKMSLWFKTAQKNVPLNNLEHRVMIGDSIIDDKSLSPLGLDWNVEFHDIMIKNKGFDIIIGNPPYFKIGKENPLNKTIDYEEIKLAGVNAAAVFINKSLKLLKDGGKLGFIVPKQLAFAKAWQKIREKIILNCKVLYLVDCRKAFQNVKLEQIIIILEKNFDNKSNIIELGKIVDKNIINIGSVPQSLCIQHDYMFLQYDDILDGIFQKITEKSKTLNDFAEVTSGTGVNHLEKKGVFKTVNDPNDLIVIKGNDIQQYYLRSESYFNKEDEKIAKYANNIEDPPRKKIVAQRIIAHIKDHIKITASFDERSSITYDTVVKIYPKDENMIWYLTGILNSKLVCFYLYKFLYNNAIRSMDFVPGYAKKTPIYSGNNTEIQQITERVLKIMAYYENVNNFNQIIVKLISDYGEKDSISLKNFVDGMFYQPIIQNKKMVIKSILTTKKEDILIIRINGKEAIKLEIKDIGKETLLRYTLESQDLDQLNSLGLDIIPLLEGIKINKIIDSTNLKFLIEKLTGSELKSDLRKKITSAKNEIDALLFNFYELTNVEKNYIEQSFK